MESQDLGHYIVSVHSLSMCEYSHRFEGSKNDIPISHPFLALNPGFSSDLRETLLLYNTRSRKTRQLNNYYCRLIAFKVRT